MHPQKIIQGPIIGRLAGFAEAAGRQFLHAAMIAQALATDALALAPGVGAVALLQVRFLVFAVLQLFLSLLIHRI
jgi:hypothetical protein